MGLRGPLLILLPTLTYLAIHGEHCGESVAEASDLSAYLQSLGFAHDFWYFPIGKWHFPT